MNTSFRKSFSRDVKKIKDELLLELIQKVIEQIEGASSPSEIDDLKKLAGTKDCFRVRLGDYRIGIVIEEDTVEFVRCLPRRDLYRFFP